MAIDLLKKKVGIVLAKRKLEKVVCEVKAAFDISGSMERMYQNGTVQNLTDRLLAVATKFDDNGELEAWTFSSSFNRAPLIVEAIHEGYVKDQILNNPEIDKWGGTYYAPMMDDIISQYTVEETEVETVVETKAPLWKRMLGQKTISTVETSVVHAPKEAEHPAFVIIQTDGENADPNETEAIFKRQGDKKIFWQFICVGNSSFHWVERMSQKYPNVGFQKFKSLENASDEEFYEKLIDEKFTKWVSAVNAGK